MEFLLFNKQKSKCIWRQKTFYCVKKKYNAFYKTKSKFYHETVADRDDTKVQINYMESNRFQQSRLTISKEVKVKTLFLLIFVQCITS